MHNLKYFSLINYIKGGDGNDPLKSHFVKSTNAIIEARRMILQLLHPLADITQLINHNLAVLEKHQNNLGMKNVELADLKLKLYTPVISLDIIRLVHPATVCVTCAEVIQVHYNNIFPTQSIYAFFLLK